MACKLETDPTKFCLVLAVLKNSEELLDFQRSMTRRVCHNSPLINTVLTNFTRYWTPYGKLYAVLNAVLTNFTPYLAPFDKLYATLNALQHSLWKPFSVSSDMASRVCHNSPTINGVLTSITPYWTPFLWRAECATICLQLTAFWPALSRIERRSDELYYGKPSVPQLKIIFKIIFKCEHVL